MESNDRLRRRYASEDLIRDSVTSAGISSKKIPCCHFHRLSPVMVQRSPGRKRTAKQVLGFAVSRMNSQQLCMVTAKLVSLRANVRIVALHLSRDADLSQSERCDAIPNAIKSIWLPEKGV
eukprot:m.342757 g.342757  ORF g.342757 m.342757 type:complete len:121 (-) comp55776_c0_seq37:2373-2735(-)